MMSPTLYQICFFLLYLAKNVKAKECRYIYENGEINYFQLMVFLTILFCSGGGWWYKIRNHEGFLTTSNAPRVMPPQLASYYGPNRPQGYTQANTCPTTQPQNAVYPQMAPMPPNAQYAPPPPYYGPPPSYDAVVSQARQG